MDINEFKKFAIPKIEAGKMLSIVKKTIKEEEYAKQDQYEDRKELYKPIVEKMDKEIDEISDLRAEFNQTAQQALMPPKQQAIMPEEQFVDLNAGFSDADLKILEYYNLPKPSDLFQQTMNDDKIVQNTLTISGATNQKLGGYKGNEEKKKKKKDAIKIQKLSKEIDTIKKYRQRINIINEGKKTYTSGKGYTHKDRNAYKIQEKGQYGNLEINIPKLVGQLKLMAYKNGKKVYDQRVDFDTLDLLTKRFNSEKKYSDLSKRVFNDLNELSGIPIHKTSKKFSKIGSGIKYFNNIPDLLSRLELLGGSIQAGNNGVKNEFSEIAHVLSKLNIISNDQLKTLLKNYII